MTDEERAELEALRAKVAEIEGTVRGLTERLGSLEAGPTPGPAPAPAPAAASAAPRAPLPREAVRRAMAARREAAVGSPDKPGKSTPGPTDKLQAWVRAFLTEGNPLNKLGALSMIIGAGIVFKYAVDNDWIGPTGRVALGLAVGAALLVAGEVYVRRSWDRFASGLVSAGNGVIFIATWFGQQQYEVIPPPVAFVLYVVVTAFVVAQSLRYDSLALAVWGLVGGYLTPALASTGSGSYVFLSGYLLVLNAGVFAIAYQKRWQPLKWMAFVLTVVYTSTWVFDFIEHPGETRWLELHWILPALGIFFLSFAAIPTWRSFRLREPIDVFGQVLTVTNGIVHFVFAVAILQEDHRAWLGLVAVAVAGLYAFATSRLVRQPALDVRALRIFAGTAAGFILLATPYLATGGWITLTWCAETVFLAWACTQPRFGFLRLHVVSMLAIIVIRLLGFDGLFDAHLPDDATSYIPFTTLRSWPPLAAAVTFVLSARLLGRVSDPGRFSVPVSLLAGIGGLVLIAAVDGEAYRVARYAFLPLASHDLQRLVQAGLLSFVICGLWLGVRRQRPAGALSWAATLFLTAALLWWTAEALVWPGGTGSMSRILGDGIGLWWLHGGVILMTPLLLVLAWLGREAPERSMGLSRDQLQALLLGAALIVTMLLLRREAFAVTYAPPLMDLLPDEARRAGYRSILSISYALLAFGVYLSAVRQGVRIRLYAAYGLYVITALKVYLFDLEFQNQLYRASSLIIFAAILFASSYYANRYANRPGHDKGTPEHA